MCYFRSHLQAFSSLSLWSMFTRISLSVTPVGRRRRSVMSKTNTSDVNTECYYENRKCLYFKYYTPFYEDFVDLDLTSNKISIPFQRLKIISIFIGKNISIGFTLFFNVFSINAIRWKVSQNLLTFCFLPWTQKVCRQFNMCSDRQFVQKENTSSDRVFWNQWPFCVFPSWFLLNSNLDISNQKKIVFIEERNTIEKIRKVSKMNFCVDSWYYFLFYSRLQQ
jgi:hypothetical protein